MEDNSAARVALVTHSWKEAYADWKDKTYNMEQNSGIVPNAKQTQILEVIHERCVLEKCHEDGQASEPLLRLVHGLPGSGKSQLLVWLRSYFQEVWRWWVCLVLHPKHRKAQAHTRNCCVFECGRSKHSVLRLR